MGVATYNVDELEALGFEFIDDDSDPHYEYVLDPKNWVESDYLYTAKEGIGRYKVLQYNGGETKVLSNWEVQSLVGDFKF